ncbi:MAG TPA: hypothetical protein VGK32_05440 [Vicinamibacterales bacterium]|jgi:hypothetical protein
MRFKWATLVAVLLGLGLSYVSGPLRAQFPIPTSTQFDLTGFLQEATLGGAGTGAGIGAHAGGTLKVNGHAVIVPSETIVIFPANALTWAEVFAHAPAPYTGVATGMAIADIPQPMTTYEVHVVGNRVIDANGDRYIAGLIYVSQQGLNSGQGYINYIDYAKGEMRVGGLFPDANCVADASPAAGGVLCSGTRVRLNDPVGRYGRSISPDVRFTVDPDNPTISAGTGYPMCFPRTNPAVLDDAACPQAMRPVGTTNFTTNAPALIPANTAMPSPYFQVPFEVGDYITYAGTLVNDTATPTAGPWPLNGAAGTYIAAHTIVANLAVFTWPGTNPAYIRTDVTLIGTGGLTVLGAGEAVIRTRFEGMSTDPTRNVHLYGIDLSPVDGSTSDRDWGTIGVDPGPPNGAVKGRWRFRPPCTATLATDKKCTPPPSGVFIPPTREMRAVIDAGPLNVPPAGFVAPITAASPTAANGIVYGQYHAPILDYIFPENIPGSPIVENNFNTIDFLAKGGYTSAAGTLIKGPLDPWPSATAPTPLCAAPTASAGGPYTVAFGGQVLLTGSSSGTAPLTFAWTASSGTFVDSGLATSSAQNPTFSAVGAVSPVAVTMTVSNACGTASSASSVTVNAAQAPTVNHLAPISMLAGSPSGNIALSGSDPNVPALLPLIFSATQSGAPALLNLTVTQGANPPGTGATLTFTAPALPLGQVTSAVITLNTQATNAANVASAVDSTTVTINPRPDALNITTAVYRTSKQRLDITANSSVISTNVVLKLQPYVTTSGSVFDPSTLGNTFTNNGGGGYILTLVGAPRPACGNLAGYQTPCPIASLTVKSNLNGTATSALTTIRQ